jgi:hypothetical protein
MTRGTAPPVLTSVLDGVEWLLHAPADLPTEKQPLYTFDRRLARPQNHSGRCGVERSICPCQESNPNRPDRSPSVYRLSCLGSVHSEMLRFVQSIREPG